MSVVYVLHRPIHHLGNPGLSFYSLNKRPGVRPIGICEVVRRIIGKVIVHILHRYIRRAAGPLQVCVGQPAGAEAAIHAISTLYSDPETEAVLLVDATNAFNLLNRQAALLNMHVLCPSLATCLTNIYRASTQLFVGGKTLLSQEGTTQGDPLAMPMFAIATIPLIERVSTAKADQIWFADDVAGGGKMLSLRHW